MNTGFYSWDNVRIVLPSEQTRRGKRLRDRERIKREKMV